MGNRKFIVTFGMNQGGGHYIVWADSYDEAIEKTVEEFGSKWAFMYTAKNWEENVHKGFNANMRGVLK